MLGRSENPYRNVRDIRTSRPPVVQVRARAAGSVQYSRRDGFSEHSSHLWKEKT